MRAGSRNQYSPKPWIDWDASLGGLVGGGEAACFTASLFEKSTCPNVIGLANLRLNEPHVLGAGRTRDSEK